MNPVYVITLRNAVIPGYPHILMEREGRLSAPLYRPELLGGREWENIKAFPSEEEAHGFASTLGGEQISAPVNFKWSGSYNVIPLQPILAVVGYEVMREVQCE